MKVTILGPITRAPNGVWQAPIPFFGLHLMPMHVGDLDATYDPEATQPQNLFGKEGEDQTWAYRGFTGEK